MTALRILMISDVYFPRINGVSTSIRTFQRELKALGHDVRLIAPAYTNDGCDREWIYRIPSRYVPIDPEDRMMQRHHIAALHDTLQRQRFDIVHIQTPFVAYYEGVKLAGRLGLPCVATFHTHFEEYLYHYLPIIPRGLMRRTVRWFNRRQCNGIDAIIVPSMAMYNLLDEYGINRPREIIATGIDEAFFRRGDGSMFRRQHGIQADRPVLVHVGRVAHEKNIDFLIQVMAVVRREVPTALLVIAGEGPALGHLNRLVRSLDLQDHVMFVGYLDRATALLDCYCAGDVFIFASNTETQGLVLLEAMAQGVPVVSTSVLGTRDILDQARGVVIAREDIDDFSGRVVKLLNEPELRALLSSQAHDYARSWSARAFAEKTVRFYQDVVDSRTLN